MNPAETRAWNDGVVAVLTIAERSAATITGASRRPIADAFAVAALGELAEAGRLLLLPIYEPLLPAAMPSEARCEAPAGSGSVSAKGGHRDPL